MSVPRVAAIGVALAAAAVGAFLLLRSKSASRPSRTPVPTIVALQAISADRAIAVRTGGDPRPRVERIDASGKADWTAALPEGAVGVDWTGVPGEGAPGGDLILVRYHGAESSHASAQGLAAYARVGGELRWTVELPTFEGVGGYRPRAPIDLPFRPLDHAGAPGVILATVDDGIDRWVVGIAPGDGAIKWKQRLGKAPHSTPVGRWLVLDTREGKLFVDTETGEAQRVEDIRSGCEVGGNYLAVVADREGGGSTLAELAGGDPAQRRVVTTQPGSLFDGADGAGLIACGRYGVERVLVVDSGVRGTRVVVLDSKDAVVRTIMIDGANCDFPIAPAAGGRLAIEGDLPRFALCAIDSSQAPIDLLGEKPATDDDGEVIPHLAMLDLEKGTIAWNSAELEAGLVLRDGARWYYVTSTPTGTIVMVFDGAMARLVAAVEIEDAARVDRRPEIMADGALWFFAPSDANKPARIAVLDAATLAPRATSGIAVRDVTDELRAKLRLGE